MSHMCTHEIHKYYIFKKGIIRNEQYKNNIYIYIKT